MSLAVDKRYDLTTDALTRTQRAGADAQRQVSAQGHLESSKTLYGQPRKDNPLDNPIDLAKRRSSQRSASGDSVDALHKEVDELPGIVPDAIADAGEAAAIGGLPLMKFGNMKLTADKQQSAVAYAINSGQRTMIFRNFDQFPLYEPQD